VYQSFWHKVPFVRFFLPFVLGISTSLFIPCNFIISSSACLFSFISFILAFHFLKRFTFAIINGLLLTATLYFFGISLNLYQNELFKEDHFIHQPYAAYLIINIDEPAIEKTKSYKLHAQAIGYIDSAKNEQTCTGNLMIYAAKDSISKQLKYGDILVIKNSIIREIPEPKNPDEFNYKRYLRFHNIHYQAYIKTHDYIKLTMQKQHPLFKWVYDVQYYFKQTLAKNIASTTEAGVAQALLYGYDDEIDPDVVQAYSNTGTLHVLAVSGMHVGLIFMILGWLLKFLDKTKRLKLIKHIVIIISLWIYSFLCGLSPSILRATVMFTFIILGQMVNRPTNVYNTLAISAFCLLCIDTNMIANVGFQLSYMAVIGIVFLQPYIYEWHDAKSWLGDQIWSITAVSLAAQIITFPLGLLYFHQFPNYFLFSNLIIIPLTTIIIYIGIVLILFSKISVIALCLGKLMYWGIALTNAIVKYVEQMPFSYVNGIHISIPQTLSIFALLACFITYFLLRKSIYFIYGLLFGCCFFVLQNVQSYENHTQQKVITYFISSHTAIHFISADQSILLVDSFLWQDKNKVRFHMQQHIWHSGVKHQQLLFTDTIWKTLVINNHHILLSGKGQPILSSKDSIVDIFFIKNNVPLKHILTQIHPKHVIITSAVKAHVAKAMKQLLFEQNIPHHFVGDSGAFELSL
jgi:competence protein ComEC